MKIEQQVTSLQLSRQLKELGIQQESYFVWVEKFPIFSNEDRIVTKVEFDRALEASVLSVEAKKIIKVYSAFTVAELGEMLPDVIIFKDGDDLDDWEIQGNLHTVKVSNGWGCGYFDEQDNSPVLGGDAWFNDNAEANARAKMLIYLIESKIIKI